MKHKIGAILFFVSIPLLIHSAANVSQKLDQLNALIPQIRKRLAEFQQIPVTQDNLHVISALTRTLLQDNDQLGSLTWTYIHRDKNPADYLIKEVSDAIQKKRAEIRALINHISAARSQ